ncbi:dihydrodipicolinate synthase family protein [Sinorhizobium alkalisoli]|uniref:dihydrodipicolinate synthase family protein n=2 Tax=Sinorhizobium alkalisoli TaxID=1752398 RepID=UPI0012A8276F|nr:dihydrodipicolinate synthase family protein [Sinorhizobium alkalisoli]MCA1492444.1 dihydrodipicolinate synthase family protein [Ensifer sp. NBAIM29]QFI67579.1 4-hydroxy-tetrahydrodipicolinate synthase [Sinorhizobium alkalisoli]
MSKRIAGIIPVMITPFGPDGKIDWGGYEALIEWYIANGSEALFAVCQSSEMRFLSLEERVDLSRFTVEKVAGRIPVVSSGHISESLDDQITELMAIADTGADAVILVSNRLAPETAGAAEVRASFDALLAALPKDVPLGLYECPAPYRRLLTDDEIDFCAQSGRFILLKDVSCDLDTVKRRATIAENTPFLICNANAAIAYAAMQVTGAGFCGVMNNFHPDLYRWLQDHGAEYPELADELAVFLVLSAQTEPMGYPKLAKLYHKRLGTFADTSSRAVPYDLHERYWALEAVIDRIVQGTDMFRARIGAASSAAV